MTSPITPDEFAPNAPKAAALLKAMANEHRLMILVHLTGGEKSVGALESLMAAQVGVDQAGPSQPMLSQPALSQHLARLRRDRLVTTRRAAQTIYYSLAGRDAAAILAALKP